MKKIYIVTILVGIVLGMSAYAASLSLSPLVVNVKQGQTFSTVVSINPQGKTYTAKVELKFPADLLSVQSFTLAPNWMALTQDGYDSINNTNGTIIKTAGYPKGLSVSTVFGTVVFKAKKTGTGSISIGSGSLALGADNKNTLAGNSGPVSVTIAAAPMISATTTPTSSVSPTPLISSEPSDTDVDNNQVGGLVAAIGDIFTLGTGNGWMVLVVIILIAWIAVIWWLYKKIKKLENK